MILPLEGRMKVVISVALPVHPIPAVLKLAPLPNPDIGGGNYANPIWFDLLDLEVEVVDRILAIFR
jgi:hypothetical protein